MDPDQTTINGQDIPETVPEQQQMPHEQVAQTEPQEQQQQQQTDPEPAPELPESQSHEQEQVHQPPIEQEQPVDAPAQQEQAQQEAIEPQVASVSEQTPPQQPAEPEDTVMEEATPLETGEAMEEVKQENDAPATETVLQINGEDTAVKESNAKDDATISSSSSNHTPASSVKDDRMDQVAREYLQSQAKPITVPKQTAAWFDMANVHEIERLSLPEFFTGRNPSKTPRIYQDYRDFMINAYRLNPNEYLALTACRRNLAGDVGAIMRVHSFLQQWGLINYQCDPTSVPSTVGPPFTGHFRVTADTPRGLMPFKPNFKSAPSNADQAKAAAAQQQQQQQQQPEQQAQSQQGDAEEAKEDKNGNESVKDGQMETGEAPKAEAEVAVKDEDSEDWKQQLFKGDGFVASKKKAMSCFTCGVDCSDTYYHCLKSRNMDICPLCYHQGRFPSTLYNADYLKIEAADPALGAMQATDSDAWSDQETLLLLEAIEQYDDDWNAIAEHVGTKTRDACLTYFLQMPIEEPYRSAMPSSHTIEHRRMPFSQADNPVMSVIAFLASAVDPQVAALAAKAAVDAQQADGTDDRANKKRKIDDMDVDEKEDDENKEKEDKSNEPRTALQQAASVALGSAAAKAHAMALIEEKEIGRIVHNVVESEIKKLDLKMNHFKDLEAVLDSELETIGQQRQQLFLQRLAVKKTTFLLQQHIRDKGGVEALVESGFSPKDLHDLLDTHLYKDNHRLVANHHLSDDALKPPPAKDDTKSMLAL
ncbi:hypothetical protein BC940DRAFT_368015 [Gongronella butleri]|nr:hypothetical protein BC940DRAFT_368015 [Gongronella butleri]